MFIDTHCHLNFKAFKKDREEVIKRAREKGVRKIIIPGAKLDSSIEAIKIAQKNAGCFAAVGIHPHHAKDFSSSTYEKLLTLADNKKVVAIGEIGLDYHYYSNYPPISPQDKELQKELLLMQLNLAKTLNLPVIFHARDSQTDLLDFIENYSTQNSYKVKGVFHCYEGTEDQLKRVLSLNFYVGFDGNITYEENSRLRELIKKTPLDRLLLETDAPYLSPIPFRRKRNEPAYLTLIAETVSEIHQEKISTIVKITTSNAVNLFHL